MKRYEEEGGVKVVIHGGKEIEEEKLGSQGISLQKATNILNKLPPQLREILVEDLGHHWE